MADQVNPVGSLAAGTLQVIAKPPPTSEKTQTVKTADSQPKQQEGRSLDVSGQNLDAATKSIQDYLKNSQSDLKFSVDKDSGRPVFQIINASTHEVIRQVPSEEVLAMAHKLEKLANPQNSSGVLMDEHA
jgi:flagellar protein FlaG